MVYKMPYKSEKILRSGQIAANVRPTDINPDSKISYLALDYGNALGTALKVPDSAALKKVDEEWDKLSTAAKFACPLTEAEAKRELAKGRSVESLF
jgi:hypothetical protein